MIEDRVLRSLSFNEDLNSMVCDNGQCATALSDYEQDVTEIKTKQESDMKQNSLTSQHQAMLSVYPLTTGMIKQMMASKPCSPLESSAQVRIHWTRDTAVVGAMTGMWGRKRAQRMNNLTATGPGDEQKIDR